MAGAMLDLRGYRGAIGPRIVSLPAEREPGGTIMDDRDAAKDPIRTVLGVFPVRDAADGMYELAGSRRVRRGDIIR